MKITMEGWCAERITDRSGVREFDLTTLALDENLCRQRIELGEKTMRNTEWLQQHPVTGVRRVRIETVDGE